jgi:hypothetical protein
MITMRSLTRRTLAGRFVIGLAFVLSLGCLAPVDDSDVSSTGAYVVEEGWMNGRMPTVGTFDADAYGVEVEDDSVTLHAGQEGGDFDGWAMTRLWMSPEDLVRLDGAQSVSVLGCAGPQHDDWDWDSSSAAIVTVEPGAVAGEHLVHFTSTWSNARVEGGFTIREAVR